MCLPGKLPPTLQGYIDFVYSRSDVEQQECWRHLVQGDELDVNKVVDMLDDFGVGHVSWSSTEASSFLRRQLSVPEEQSLFSYFTILS